MNEAGARTGMSDGNGHDDTEGVDAYALSPRLAQIFADLPQDALAFTPVPVRARHDGWTAPRQRGFIRRLALCGSVSAAAKAVGMTRNAAYALRNKAGADSFARAWDAALAMGASQGCDRALERALLGETRPVFYRGRKVGEHVRYNESLTIAVLRHRDPSAPRADFNPDRD
jgi:hypothetical protein